MAKVKTTSTVTKLSFGKRKSGKARKSHNKHDRKERTYHGQGR